ncbi:TRAP transporter large permease [Phyllobacterium chamaecytisi]|uniref:TRAP transporter large permease n=1 Tax=Phyllobacterium chamaecytisi TaxID=2876082 RepID=UPI001CCD4429|nr:TRAP transporter large permease subunit [Phyllobacterium sp. KW56]MBZ9603233.1 TRAP transporter large permease subunit [Phyllobacterium sp. KW56]
MSVNAHNSEGTGIDHGIAGHAPVTQMAMALGALAAVAGHIGAVMLIAEIVLLSAAVFFRYVLHAPLVWSDELAELILIWQAMLGSVVAFHAGQHLKLDFLAKMLPRAGRAYLETLCLILIVLISAPLAYFAFKEAHANLGLLTPALEISPAWRMSALVVGLALIALLAAGSLIDKIAEWAWGPTIAAFGTMAVVLIAAWLLRNAFLDLGNYNLLIFFLGLGGICIAIGVPIAFCFAIAATAYVLFAAYAPLEIVPARMETGMAHILLLSAPLFIVLGSMLVISGMANNMVKLLVALIGHVKGGLSYALVGAMALVSGISGSKAADMAAIAPVLMPEMRKRGAQDGEIVGLLAASCAMSETIPPSLILIMTGAVTGVSIGALFAAGWYAALALAFLLCVLSRFRAMKSGDVPTERASWRTVRKLAVVAVPVLVLPFLIRGAVVEGIATATEVATIGIAYILVLTLVIERRFDWKKLYVSMKDASTLTGVIFIILAAANAMAWGFVQSGFSDTLADMAERLPGGAYGFLLISIMVFMVLGSVLEGIPAVVLFGPLLFPVAGNFGLSEVHFALIAVMAMGLGLFAPPFGVGFYTACAICGVEPVAVMKAIWSYLGVILVGIIIIALGPVLAAHIGLM